jgi:hypothetical protein
LPFFPSRKRRLQPLPLLFPPRKRRHQPLPFLSRRVSEGSGLCLSSSRRVSEGSGLCLCSSRRVSDGSSLCLTGQVPGGKCWSLRLRYFPSLGVISNVVFELRELARTAHNVIKAFAIPNIPTSICCLVDLPGAVRLPTPQNRG